MNWIKKIIEAVYQKQTFFKIFIFITIISAGILLFASVSLYLIYEGASIREIQKKSSDQLKQTMNVFSSLNSLIISSAIQLRSETVINHLMYQKNLDLYEISRGLDRLDNTMTSYPFLHSIYIYNYQRNEYFSTIHGIEGPVSSDQDLPEIIMNIKTYRIFNYIPRVMKIKINDRIFNPVHGIVKVNAISLIIGETPLTGTTIKGALILNLSEEKLRSYFLAVNEVSGGELIILDKNGQILSQPEKSFFNNTLTESDILKKIMTEKKTATVFAIRINGKKYLISSLTHPQMGWQFINILKYDEIFKEINNLKNLTIIILVGLILGSGILALIFTRFIYRPIRYLFQSATRVKDQLQLVTDDKKNELQYFDDVMQQMMNKMTRQDHYIERYKNNTYHEMLKQILTGQLLSTEIIGIDYPELTAFFTHASLMLALISIDRHHLYLNYYTNEMINQWLKNIPEIIQKTINNKHFTVIMQHHQYIIINRLENEPAASIDQFITQLKTIQITIKDQLHITGSIAVSQLIMNENEIPAVYQDLVKLIQYRFRTGIQSFIIKEALPPLPLKEYIYPEEKIKILLNELKLGKLDKVEKILQEVMEDIRQYSYEDFHFMIQLLAYQSLKMVANSETDSHYELNACKKKLTNLTETDTIPDALNIFLNAANLFVKIIASLKVNKKAELISTIKSYIEQNIFDYSLCPDTLSTVTGFSTHYLRNIFKENTGISISDYIHNLRLDFAKKLLVQTRKTVKEIARESGFSNHNYFFTAFKKHTSLTPEIYRQKHKLS